MTLQPSSAESLCVLGGLYKELGLLHNAGKTYLRAIEPFFSKSRSMPTANADDPCRDEGA